MELLIPADVEGGALGELSDGYASNGFPQLTVAAKTVGTKITSLDPKPDDFVRLIATGGAERDLVTDDFTLIVEGYSTSERRAQQVCALGLAILQRAARQGAIGGMTCYRVRGMSLPANLPNPAVPGRFRYTATLSASLRRRAV